MKLSNILPFILIFVGLLLITGFDIIKYFDLFILIFVGLLLIILYKNRKIIYKIEQLNEKGNYITIEYNGKVLYIRSYKLIAKVSSTTSKIDYNNEIENLMNIIIKKFNNIKIIVFTGFSKNTLGSNLVIYTDDKEAIEEVNKEIYNVIEVVAPNIQLVPVNTSGTEVIAIPKDFGNIPFMKIIDKMYETPQVESARVNYDIQLGIIKDRYNSPIGIKVDEIFRHIGIFGTTGSGKTNTAMLLALGAHKQGIQVIVFDWHGEYSKLKEFMLLKDSNLLKVNPLNPGVSSLEEQVEILGDVFQLTDPQKFLLFIVFSKMKKIKKFNLKILLIVLKSIRDTSYWIRDVKYALFRKLYILFTNEAKKLFGNQDSYSQNILDIISGSTIFDLSSIRSITLKKLYVLYLLKLITDDMIKKKENGRKILVILEEAHNYLNSQNEFISRIFSEVRKFNVGLCVVTQSPSSINKEVLANINTFILHNIKSDLDKRAIRDSLGLSDDMLNILDKLEAGEAIILSPSIKKQTLIKINKVE